MEKQMAIMKNVRWIYEDHYGPGLYFDTYIEEASAASHYLPAEEAFKLLMAYKVIKADGVKFSDLEGKPVWVKCEGNFIRFVGPYII